MSAAIKTAAVGCLLFSLNACADSQTMAIQANLGGQSLKLIDAQGQCAVLKPDNTQLALGMEWPCQFSPDRKGQVRVEVFKSVPIVLVEHTDPEKTPGAGCLTKSQAIRLRSGVLETSSVNQSAMCGRGVQDQKMFVGMFRW
jgi:hypothetical protein